MSRVTFTVQSESEAFEAPARTSDGNLYLIQVDKVMRSRLTYPPLVIEMLKVGLAGQEHVSGHVLAEQAFV